MGAIADKYDFTADQGANFIRDITVKAGGQVVDVTGYKARMQIRTDFDSNVALLTIHNGNYLTVGGIDGKIDINVPATVMAGIPYDQYVYDFEVESPGGEVTRLLMGKFILRAEVTRWVS